MSVSKGNNSCHFRGSLICVLVSGLSLSKNFGNQINWMDLQKCLFSVGKCLTSKKNISVNVNSWNSPW